MKSFIAALVLLGSLLAGVVTSSLLLSADTASMKEEAGALYGEKGRKERIETFCEDWERRQVWYMMTLHANELERMDEAVAAIRAAEKSKSDSDYMIAVAKLEEACDRLHDLVGFRVGQIL